MFQRRNDQMGKEKHLPGLLCQIFVCVRVYMCVFVFSHAIVTAASPETAEQREPVIAAIAGVDFVASRLDLP
jgi:hypothetical protein